MASVSKTYAPGGTSATNGGEKAARPPRRSRRTGAPHAGHRHAGPRPRLLRGGGRLHLRLRTTLESDAFSSREWLRLKTLWRSTTMIFDYSLAAIVSAGLLFYLTYALLRPERF